MFGPGKGREPCWFPAGSSSRRRGPKASRSNGKPPTAMMPCELETGSLRSGMNAFSVPGGEAELLVSGSRCSDRRWNNPDPAAKSRSPARIEVFVRIFGGKDGAAATILEGFRRRQPRRKPSSELALVADAGLGGGTRDRQNRGPCG